MPALHGAASPSPRAVRPALVLNPTRRSPCTCPAQALIDRVKTFKEVNVNYIAAEAQVFHFDEPRCFAELYGGLPPPQGLTPLPVSSEGSRALP